MPVASRSIDGAAAARVALARRAAGWVLLKFVIPLPLPGGEFRAALLRFTGMKIGDGTSVGSRCTFVGSRVTLGARSFINWGVTFDATVEIVVGDGVSIAPGTMLVTGSHEIGPASRRAGPLANAPVRIGDGCWLGARATVLPGVTIGEGCVIAAGAVVAHDCEPNGLYAGVPARRVRDLDPRGVGGGAAAGEQSRGDLDQAAADGGQNSVDAGQRPADADSTPASL